jgi:hypothetical protein
VHRDGQFKAFADLCEGLTAQFLGAALSGRRPCGCGGRL